MAENKEVGTTGHQWDDEEGYPLKEFNNPLPRWWVNSFYATIVFSVIYWIFYPAWPLANDFTRGLLGWSQHKQLAAELAAAKAAKKPFDDSLEKMTLAQIAADPKLRVYALAGGKSIFGDNCAPCHGSGGGGAKGFPALVDDDWLYGGSLEAIQTSIAQGRTAMMPPHLAPAGALTQPQVQDLTEYVLSLSGKSTQADAIGRGNTLFHGEAGCNNCHGDLGKGSLLDKVGGQPLSADIGAPNLTDNIWLYGGDKETVFASIARGRSGQMPAWGKEAGSTGRHLDALAIKEVA
ncbi:MAG: cytochrome-c oxidase, cbb3-type subunit III, partial [Magnetococcales bacterium]|nr:cytochrome-c oxidase, cbb3-type subunit III [Magnetococcales bacterium]